MPFGPIFHSAASGTSVSGTVTFTGNVSAARFLAADDTVSLPGFAYQQDPNTGVYKVTSGDSNLLALAAGGSAYLRVGAAVVTTLSGNPLASDGQVLNQGVISPASLGSNQNDYNPASMSVAHTIRQDCSTTVSLTGLQGGSAGRRILLMNISAANSITLAHDSASSTAANRFYCPNGALFTIRPHGSVYINYDSTSSRWRVEGE